jgi:hypothetical protein
MLASCRRAAIALEKAEEDRGLKTEEVLSRTFDFRCYLRAHPKATKTMHRAYKEAGIRLTKSTANPFTPLVKLIFPNTVVRGSLSRYASALLFAEKEKVKSGAFANFLKKEGGVGKCASRLSAMRRAANGRADSSEALVAKLKKLRKTATVVKLDKAIKLSNQGFDVLLVERVDSRTARLLAQRPVGVEKLPALLKIQ